MLFYIVLRQSKANICFVSTGRKNPEISRVYLFHIMQFNLVCKVFHTFVVAPDGNGCMFQIQIVEAKFPRHNRIVSVSSENKRGLYFLIISFMITSRDSDDITAFHEYIPHRKPLSHFCHFLCFLKQKIVKDFTRNYKTLSNVFVVKGIAQIEVELPVARPTESNAPNECALEFLNRV